MQLYWWLLIPAILLAIFSDRIDKAVKADKKLGKVVLVFGSGVALVCFIAILASYFIS